MNGVELAVAQACHDAVKSATPKLYEAIADSIKSGATPRQVETVFKRAVKRSGKRSTLSNEVFYTALIISRGVTA